MKKRKYDRGLQTVPVLVCDLRALLFWATHGVTSAVSGSYPRTAETAGDPGVINAYAVQIKFKLPRRPVFRDEAGETRHGQ